MKTPTYLSGLAGIIILNLSFTSCATSPAAAPTPTPGSSKHATAARTVERELHPESGDWKLALQEGGD